MSLTSWNEKWVLKLTRLQLEKCGGNERCHLVLQTIANKVHYLSDVGELAILIREAVLREHLPEEIKTELKKLLAELADMVEKSEA